MDSRQIKSLRSVFTYLLKVEPGSLGYGVRRKFPAREPGLIAADLHTHQRISSIDDLLEVEEVARSNRLSMVALTSYGPRIDRNTSFADVRAVVEKYNEAPEPGQEIHDAGNVIWTPRTHPGNVYFIEAYEMNCSLDGLEDATMHMMALLPVHESGMSFAEALESKGKANSGIFSAQEFVSLARDYNAVVIVPHLGLLDNDFLPPFRLPKSQGEVEAVREILQLSDGHDSTAASVLQMSEAHEYVREVFGGKGMASSDLHIRDFHFSWIKSYVLGELGRGFTMFDREKLGLYHEPPENLNGRLRNLIINEDFIPHYGFFPTGQAAVSLILPSAKESVVTRVRDFFSLGDAKQTRQLGE